MFENCPIFFVATALLTQIKTFSPNTTKNPPNLVSKKHCVAKKLSGNVNGDQIVQMFSLSQFLSTNLETISNVVFACWQTWIALVTFQAACHSVILSPPPSPPSPCGSPPLNIKHRHTVPKVIDFPRYKNKCSVENVILRGIFHLVSGFLYISCYIAETWSAFLTVHTSIRIGAPSATYNNNVRPVVHTLFQK